VRYRLLLCFFPEYPLLPSGCLLSLFLGPDGGPREGAIRLPPEKVTTDVAHPTIPEEESLPASPVATLPRKPSIYEGLRKASRTFSDVFASRVPSPTPPTPVPLSQSPSANRPFPRTSRADGYAYGYGGALSFGSRVGSNASAAHTTSSHTMEDPTLSIRPMPHGSERALLSSLFSVSALFHC